MQKQEAEVTTTLELETPWTLWYDTEKEGHREFGSWTNQVHKLVTINTIPAFWQVIGLAPAPSRLVSGSNYSLFRRDTPPAWESNPNGGKFILNLPQTYTRLDSIWLDTMLALVGGEAFSGGLGVDGVVAGIRTSGKERIALWTKNCDSKEVIAIGAEWRKILAIPDKLTIEFFPHSSRLSASASTPRSGPLRPQFAM